MKKWKHIVFWLFIICLAILSILDIISLPSESEGMVLFGFTIQRLALVLIPLLCIIFAIVILVLILSFPERYIQILSTSEKVPDGKKILIAYVGFWVVIFAGGMLLYYRIAISPKSDVLVLFLGEGLKTLCAYMDRLWGLLVFAIVCIAIVSCLIFIEFPQHFAKNKQVFIDCGAGIAILAATIFQWIVFVFELHVFEKIPGWYWPIIHKSNVIQNGIIFSLILLFILFIQLLLHLFPKRKILSIFLISLAFLGLQFSIGMMEGRGLASLTDRFFLSYHRIYIEEACNASIPSYEAIRQYEDLYPSMFLKTKPPGVLWSAFLIKNIANIPILQPLMDSLSDTFSLSIFLPRMNSSVCKRSMVLVTLLFPLISLTTIWLLFWFFKVVLVVDDYEQQAGYSSILFILAPNIVMLSLFMDQAIYPPLFLFLVGLLIISMQKKSPLFCLLCGIVIYAALFLSFSLLPVLAIPIIYFICVLWQEKRKNFNFWHYFCETLLPMGLGLLLSMTLFRLILNYDIFTRYRNMMETRIEGDFYTRLGLSSHGSVTFLEKINQIWNAALLNNVELAVAIGFPIFILFFVMGFRSLFRVIRRESNKLEAINVSLFLTYIFLNAIRVVLGEVGRLWMFWIPIMAILTVQYMFPLTERKKWIMAGLIVIQTLSVFITYQYQDYFMPQLLP